MSLLKDDPERQKIREVSGSIYWGNEKKWVFSETGMLLE